MLNSKQLIHHVWSTTQWAEHRTVNLGSHRASISLQSGVAAEVPIRKHAKIRGSREGELCALFSTCWWPCSAQHCRLPEGTWLKLPLVLAAGQGAGLCGFAGAVKLLLGIHEGISARDAGAARDVGEQQLCESEALRRTASTVAVKGNQNIDSFYIQISLEL